MVVVDVCIWESVVVVGSCGGDQKGEMEMEEMGMGVEVEKGLEVEMELEGMGKRYLQLIFYLMLKGLYLEEIHFSHVPWSLEHFVYGCKSLAFW